jgi:DNA-binding transcriptional MerR regulator
MYNGDIMTSKDVLELLQISKNTLIELERDLVIEPDFRIGNRKRYFRKSIRKSIEKMEA